MLLFIVKICSTVIMAQNFEASADHRHHLFIMSSESHHILQSTVGALQDVVGLERIGLSGELPQLVKAHPSNVEVMGSNLVGSNLMDIQVKEQIRALIPGSNLMGFPRIWGHTCLRSEIEESILAINRQDN
ncbi:hypothetical protein E3N88_01069 [Mikania micrantha]|uniref:Uncharacterized protein n=1 Tax=Mikania micrantha TaxID=192012 RepID=A0A5N6Q0N1_9ASTR|nr:hypothetical protein E3N88_01069 [Mikania micrantha]